MLNNSMEKSEVYYIILATTDMNEDVYAYLCGRTHVCNSTVSLSVEKPARLLPSGITGSMAVDQPVIKCLDENGEKIGFIHGCIVGSLH